MVNFLAALGLIFVVLAFWRGRSQAAREQQELEEYKKIKNELAETKKEVDSLLEQLEAVSEKVVEEITATVDEARRSGQEPVTPKACAQETVTEGGRAEVSLELSGRQTEAKNYHREKPLSRTGTDCRPDGAGKTITFPLRPESTAEVPAAANHCQPGREAPPKHQMVYAMARLGCSEADIAKQLSVGRGEVRLILQLKRKGEEANG